MASVFSPLRADTYPERPIQLVVPAGPGSSTDTIMRSLAQVAAPTIDARPYLAKISTPVLALYPTGSNVSSADQEAALRENIASVRVTHLETRPMRCSACCNRKPAPDLF
jgi:hypothetical protein